MPLKLDTESFIIKAKEVHGDKYDYSKAIYVNARTPVEVICPKHGSFFPKPYKHLEGRGCPKCAGRDKTTEDIIAEFKEVYGDRYDYSLTIYEGPNKKVKIICPKHGIFEKLPYEHAHGEGCPQCSVLERRYTTEEYIKKAKEVHGDKYDYSSTHYSKNDEKVEVICPLHGPFFVRANKHLEGHGCPRCAGLYKTTEELIKEFKAVHGDKYDYSEMTYVDSQTKVKIICPEHGPFEKFPHEHLHGEGCPICATINRGLKRRSNTEEFIEKARKVHGDKYDYTQLEYVDSSSYVKIICPKHGVFMQKPNVHLSGAGCPFCTGRYKKEEEVKELLKTMRGDEYDYSQINYVNTQEKITIICPKHGPFQQLLHDHLHKGQGCPICAVRLSKAELEITDFLKSFGLEVERSNTKILNRKELDIYVPSLKLAIEFNGIHWHTEDKGKDKDYHLKKTEECEKQGIHLIHIFEDEWLDHKEIVLSKLKHISKMNDGQRIFGRKCSVKEISKIEAKRFLELNHIQGFAPSTIYLGAFHEDKLIAVMSFKSDKKGNGKWELTRYASDNNLLCVGVGGKLFKYFISHYSFSIIKSFADRRWTSTLDENLYTRLGFSLAEILKPDYKYIIPQSHKRHHKFGFRKQILHKRYGLALNMTEYQMTQELGFHRIWDCGLLRYEYRKVSPNAHALRDGEKLGNI